VCHFFWRSTLVAYPLSLIAQAGTIRTLTPVVLGPKMVLSLKCVGSYYHTYCYEVVRFSVLFKLPAFFEIVLNESGQIMPSSLRLDSTYQLIYMTYMYVICILLLPWIIIIVLNGVVIQKVRSISQLSDITCHLLTVMTVVMTGIFVLCNIPPAINNIIESYAPQYREKYRQRIPLSTLLVCVN
ncbi:hypothetical protein Angca_000258, partial [Angiostrongylus cantonensis]